jgi:hypothetical protein
VTYQNTAQEKMKAMINVRTRIVVIIALENCFFVLSIARLVNAYTVPVAIAGTTIPHRQASGKIANPDVSMAHL